MPPARHNPHDPFTTSSTASGTGLRTQASQQSLRSTASAASTSASRTREQQRDQLFAPSLSRRPTSHTRVEDKVLADSSSEQELRSRRPRAQHKSRQQQAEEQDIVKRDAQGNYLLGGSDLGMGGTVPAVKPLVQEDEDEARMGMLNTATVGDKDICSCVVMNRGSQFILLCSGEEILYLWGCHDYGKTH